MKEVLQKIREYAVCVLSGVALFILFAFVIWGFFPPIASFLVGLLSGGEAGTVPWFGAWYSFFPTWVLLVALGYVGFMMWWARK